MAVSFFAFLALVQREALSFAVPASAASFILETILARTLLKEHLDKKRMIGAVWYCAALSDCELSDGKFPRSI